MWSSAAGRSKLNSKGQMAIFVALIFQVLFVFFAMMINIALVVHDKINLQNAVDLAAYYYAQKQAEILNAMAHQNYQVRQAFKLLTWRYRVLASMGVEGHPTNPGVPQLEVPFDQALPYVCVIFHPMWPDFGADKTTDLCSKPRIYIPPIPESPVVNPFLPTNFLTRLLVENARKSYQRSCRNGGVINWWFANVMVQSFRMEQANRREMIHALARDLSSGQQGEFLDINGESVAAGVRETFRRNLSTTNLESFDSGEGGLRLFNSLEGQMNGDRVKWLADILIRPLVLYIDLKTDPCEGEPKWHYVRPLGDTALFDPEGILQQWNTWNDPTSFMHPSVGVEKNPWFMAYVGVKARTKPRQLFWPVGDFVTLEARAFAKPFGGNIGPWSGVRWARSASQSDDGDLGFDSRTDPLLPPRSNGIEFNTEVSESEKDRLLPNYSRFPGDKLGLKSSLALSAMNGLNRQSLLVPYDFYQGTIVEFGTSGAPNDTLAWDIKAPGRIEQIGVRRFEIAALAPDLFDAAYYSVDPQFNAVYYSKLLNLVPKLKGAGLLRGEFVLRTDLGMHTGSGDADTYDVQSQIRMAQEIYKPNIVYFLRDRSHLLTSWAPNRRTADYTFPADLIGQCAHPDERVEKKTPGGCLAGGGRSGYSVKLVSRSHLLSSDHPLGGRGGGAGPIENPPPQDF